MTAAWFAVACHAITLIVLALALHRERRAHARTRAELDAQRATTDAARALYGEARMREAARCVALRERSD